jgi:lysophospholipase L1-like esterase
MANDPSNASILSPGPPPGPPPSPRRRRFVPLALRTLVLLATGSLFAFAFAEALVRVVDPMGISYFRHMADFQRRGLQVSQVPGLYFEHVPGVRIDVGVPVRIDSLGLRGDEVAQPKPAGLRRILVLGDSVAFGWGVPEEVTFERRLAETLTARGKAKVEVLNAGVIMFNTVQERLLFDARGAALAPDLVLLVYCNNDVLGAHTSPLPAQSGGARPAELDGLVSRLDWWLLTNSWRFSVTDLLRQVTMERLTREMGQRGGSDETSARRREIVRRYVESASAKVDTGASYAALAAIAKRCKEIGAPLVVVPFGAPADLAGVCERLGVAYAAEAEGINVDPKCRLSRVDPHPNAEGHRQLAERILHALDRLGL